MISKKLVNCILAASIALFGVGACGDDSNSSPSFSCEEYCTKKASCPDPFTAPPDCKAKCETVIQTVDCRAEFEAFALCTMSKDVCGALTECERQTVAFLICVMDYCEAHPHSEGC